MDDHVQTLRELVEDLRGHIEMHQGFGIQFTRKADPAVPTLAAFTPPAAAQRSAASIPVAHKSPAAPAQVHQTTPARGRQPGTQPQRVYRPEAPVLHDIPKPPEIAADDPFHELRQEVKNCDKCELCRQRINTVFGEGDPDSNLVFVGEGPGADEDRQGRPFVGRAGKMLTQIIHKGMNLHRHQVYICNIVKCRPPENRAPTISEMLGCKPYLMQQLTLIKPKVIVALGATAVHGLFGEKLPITKIRGQFREWNGIQVMPTFHPSFLIRQYTAENRRAVWEDVQAVLDLLRELGSPLAGK